MMEHPATASQEIVAQPYLRPEDCLDGQSSPMERVEDPAGLWVTVPGGSVRLNLMAITSGDRANFFVPVQQEVIERWWLLCDTALAEVRSTGTEGLREFAREVAPSYLELLGMARAAEHIHQDLRHRWPSLTPAIMRASVDRSHRDGDTPGQRQERVLALLDRAADENLSARAVRRIADEECRPHLKHAADELTDRLIYGDAAGGSLAGAVYKECPNLTLEEARVLGELVRERLCALLAEYFVERRQS